MLLPTTSDEMNEKNWPQVDIILVTGDSYIDSPFMGSAVIGNILSNAGFRVGIIAQPDISSPDDICRLGEPRLFWGVSGGSIDSMVANYTALKKKRKSDDLTPGGVNNRRPDRAVIAYSNLIRRWFKHTRPIVLGGIEASLRRIAHYDYWSDKIRASILLDAKADFLLYGMAERSILDLANTINNHTDPRTIRGLCYPINASQLLEIPSDYIELPSYQSVKTDPIAFIEMFHTFYHNNDPITAKGLYQQHNTRYIVQTPPSPYVAQEELDKIYGTGYTRTQHPYYEQQGKVKASETIQFSISTHRGCYGECNFCAIAAHEGRTVRWRSKQSILEEARSFLLHPDFKGIIPDLGAPTANMYGFECTKKLTSGTCTTKHCITTKVCQALNVDHSHQISLLKKIRRIPGIKHVYVSSGIRVDLVINDYKYGREYLEQVATHHTSGQLKVAPEHSEAHVLKLMGKPDLSSLDTFTQWFNQISNDAGKEQYLTYYMIAAHPGCTDQDMRNLRRFAGKKLGSLPEQIQIFTPTPSTYSSVMYHTGLDPFTLQPIFVEKNLRKKEQQKRIMVVKAYTKRSEYQRTKRDSASRSSVTRRIKPSHTVRK